MPNRPTFTAHTREEVQGATDPGAGKCARCDLETRDKDVFWEEGDTIVCFNCSGEIVTHWVEANAR